MNLIVTRPNEGNVNPPNTPVGGAPTARKKTRSRYGSVAEVALRYSMDRFTVRPFNLSGYGNSILFLL